MLHNNKLCKKIYRLELSNIPYIIHKNDLDLLYKMVWYISYKYNILGYEGTIVNKMLNNNYDSIIKYAKRHKKIKEFNKSRIITCKMYKLYYQSDQYNISDISKNF